MSKATKSAPKSAKTPKVRDVSVSFDEFIGLRQLNAGLSAPNPILNRLARKNLVEMTEKYETVLARETKTTIFYKKVVTRNARMTAKGFALIERLNAAL